MKELILIRHAHASADKGIKDIDRPLTPEGQMHARNTGRWLKDRDKTIELFFSSTAARAQMTGEEIMEVLNRDVGELTTVTGLYDASVRTFLDFVNQLNEKINRVLIVGHNPTVTYLSEYLINNSIGNMPPGSGVIIGFENLKWGEISEGSGQLLVAHSLSDD